MTTILLTVAASTLAIFLAMMAVGRWLKRRAGLRLGPSYQLFALSAGLLASLTFAKMDGEIQRAAQACAILFGTFFMLAVLKRGLWQYYFEEQRGTKIPKFVRDLVALALVILAIAGILGWVYGIRIPGLLTGSGIVAIILGLSMQETLGNLVAGMSLQFEKAFKAGDWLIVADHQAEVMEVNWRSTRLRSTDNIYYDIPNSQLARQTVVNLTYPNRLHAMRLPVRVENAAPPNRVREVLLRAASSVPGVMASPAPKVFVLAFEESCIHYELKFWLEDQSLYNDLRDAIMTNVWYGLDRQGIRLAFARRLVTLQQEGESRPRDLTIDFVEALRRQPVFHCLAEEQAQALLAGAASQRFGRGERIIEQGSSGESMFLLVGGEADVLVGSTGRSDRVATLRSGDCFGEMSLLTGENRSATVQAKTDCTVLEVGKEGMARLLQSNPNLVHELSELLAHRQRQNEQTLSAGAKGANEASRLVESRASFLAKLRAFFSL